PSSGTPVIFDRPTVRARSVRLPSSRMSCSACSGCWDMQVSVRKPTSRGPEAFALCHRVNASGPRDVGVRTLTCMSQQPEQAEQLIRELGSLTDRARTVGRSKITGVPLLGWGFAFGAGYTALDLLDGAARLVVVLLAWAIGML